MEETWQHCCDEAGEAAQRTHVATIRAWAPEDDDNTLDCDAALESWHSAELELELEPELELAEGNTAEDAPRSNHDTPEDAAQ